MLACVFITGIVWAKTDQFFVLLLFLFILIIKIWDLIYKNKYKMALGWGIILLVFFALAVWDYNSNLQFRAEYSNKISDGLEVKLCGRIYRIEERNESFRYYLKECRIMSADRLSCNNVIAYCDSNDYSLGDSIYISGKIHTFEKATNSGMFDMEKFYFSQKIDYAVYVSKVISCKKETLGIENAVYLIREKLKKSIEDNMSEPYSGILISMLLGDKALLDDMTKNMYQKTGISHILAISGLHISLVGMTLYKLLRKCSVGFVASGILGGVSVFLYAIMTGGMVSTVRAVGMFIIIVTGQALGRRADLLNSLGIMIIFLLYDDPFLLDYAGFDMSVMAIVGIGVAGKILTLGSDDLLEGDERKKYSRKLTETVRVSMGIQLVTIPVVAYFYYEIPVYSIFINLMVIPLLELIFLLGSTGAVLGMAFPILGHMLLFPVEWILKYYDVICNITMKLPFAQLITGKPSVLKMTLYYIVLGVIMLLIYVGRKNKEHYKGMFKWIDKTRILCFVILFLFISINKTNGFEIDVIDVGQGDATYISDGSGMSYFIDGGSTDVSEVGKNRIIPFLKSKGVRRIDYWFVSHTDADHYNGLIEVLMSGYPVKHVVLSKNMPVDEELELIKESSKINNTSLVYMDAGDTVKTNKSELKCISYYADDTTDKNDLSLVLLYRDKYFTGMLTGDISEKAEKELISKNVLCQVDYLKVAHHGSKYSSSKEFVEKTSPVFATISCGLHNSYGHPGKEAINNLEKVGAKIFYTMNEGEITIRRSKCGFAVDHYKKE